MYNVGEIVEGNVCEIIPSGVFVRLEDGSIAYIKRRELTLDGDIDPKEVVQIGEKIKGYVKELATEKRLTCLSRIELFPNPWIAFTKKLHESNILKAVVKKVYEEFILVQVEPGITGTISKDELPVWLQNNHENNFWKGDHIEAMVIYYHPERKILRLSISRRLEQISQADAVIGKIYKIDDKNDLLISNNIVESNHAEIMSLLPQNSLDFPVLLLMDDDEFKTALVECFQKFNYKSQIFYNTKDAIDQFPCTTWSTAIIDIDFQTLEVFTFINMMKREIPNLPLAVIGNSVNINHYINAGNSTGISAIFIKPFEMDEFSDFLFKVAEGTPPKIINTEKNDRKSENGLIELGSTKTILNFDQQNSEGYKVAIDDLITEIGAESGILFHYDREVGRITIVTSVGKIPINSQAVYRLIESPVKDVICENDVIFKVQIIPNENGRFLHLLELLDFNSCIGLPISIDGRNEFAIFVFHRKSGVFSKNDIKNVIGIAKLIEVNLEKHIFINSLRPISSLILSGELFYTLNHEVFNPLSSMWLTLINLQSKLSGLEKNITEEKKLETLRQIYSDFHIINQGFTNFQTTIERFRTLDEIEHVDSIDILNVINQICDLLRQMAKNANIRFEIHHDPKVPSIICPTSVPYHILLNLMLNAIQHMKLTPKPQGILTVSTKYDQEKQIIRVNVMDSGPGIHHALWEKIFKIGFTTRPGGSGFGLYIIKKLLESISGRIFVDESFIAIGSSFTFEIRKNCI